MASDKRKSVIQLKGIVKHHTDWVTSISTPNNYENSTFISSSRDKTMIVWNVEGPNALPTPMKSLKGHSQPIQDCAMSNDAKYAMSASWDHSLRLWDLCTGRTVRKFVGHTSDVFSVAFSPDNRQIVSGSRDRTIKLWNTLAACKMTVAEGLHTDWVSCVRYSPAEQPIVVSAGWDKLVKVWDFVTGDVLYDLVGHTASLHTVAISPDGSLCASGGKDGVAMLWDATEGKHLSSLEANSPINSLCFSPCNYWLCAATDKDIKVWSLEASQIVLAEEVPENPKKDGKPWCTCLTWSKDGSTLFAGTTGGEIYMYQTEE